VTLFAIALLQEGNPEKETIMIKSRIIVTGARRLPPKWRGKSFAV
jgi:hypothetical protein